MGWVWPDEREQEGLRRKGRAEVRAGVGKSLECQGFHWKEAGPTGSKSAREGAAGSEHSGANGKHARPKAQTSLMEG